MSSLKTFPMGGVHPPENKLSSTSQIEKIDIPEMINIPVAQHLGSPASAIVKKGDPVKVGTLIAESSGFISANIHSSVSGVVHMVGDVLDSSGYARKCVTIKVEGDEWEDTIDSSVTLKKECNLTPKEIVDKIRENGVVGLGGATFPSFVKSMVPDGKSADVLIINGVECEPYLTADHVLMLERGHEMMVGITIVMKALSVRKAVIGIENNKPDAIKYLRELTNEYPGIEVQALKVMYPQGGEKQLIKAITGREVPNKGGLPIDVGTVVHNVGTLVAIYEAVQKNKPLIDRVVTLTGKSITKPANYLVRVGTSVSELITKSGGLPSDTGKIINGGPMMGKAITSPDVPIVKGSSGILLIRQGETLREKEINCIRCAKCMTVCPQGLEPYLLCNLAKIRNYEKLESEDIMNCIECGSCSYTCPSNVPLLDYIRVAKFEVGTRIRNR